MRGSPDVLIQEILARCLTDPPFLARLVADRNQALTGYSLDEPTLADFAVTDVDRLREFSGFIAKVQHNYLWDSFPATRQLLKHYKAEIEFFAGYRSVQLSAQTPAQTQSEKIRRFADHLLRFAGDNPRLAGLATALRYERACWDLHQLACVRPARGCLAAAQAGALDWPEFLRLVPVPSGPIRVDAFDCNPAKLVADVLNGTFTGHRAGTHRLFVLRLDATDRTLQTFEIEELPALLLSYLDGRRSVRSVISAARHRALAKTPPRAFRAFFEEAAAGGFIRLCRRTRCA